MKASKEHKPQQSRVIISETKSHNIQRRWIYDGDNKLKTEGLYDGVRWYSNNDKIYFKIEGDVVLGNKICYKQYEGEENARSWDKWNEISILPFIKPTSTSNVNYDRDSIINSIKNGFLSYPTKKRAMAALKLNITDVTLVNIILNKELAKGNEFIIKIMGGFNDVDTSIINCVKSQFIGMDISDTGDEKEIANAIKAYTLSDYENVTAFVRGYIWSKSESKYIHASRKMRLKGARLLASMNENWEKAPYADIEYSWRTENGDLGEISKGALGKEYKKTNPASTSVHIIPKRAQKKENILLKIKNTKHKDKKYRQPIDVRKYSQYTDESEILYPAYTIYKIENTAIQKDHNDNNYYNVNATPPLVGEAYEKVNEFIDNNLQKPPIDSGHVKEENRHNLDKMVL